MARNNRIFIVFLLYIFLLTPTVTDTRQTRTCSLLASNQRSSVLRYGHYKYCDTPDSCKCNETLYPNYCYFGDDCEVCLYQSRSNACKDNNGLTSPPDKTTISAPVDSCMDDSFLCDGKCWLKSWKKECDGKCVTRTNICEAEGQHCNVSHTPEAIDWICGGRCRNDVSKEKSSYFHCGGLCKDKITYKECNNLCMKRSKLCDIDEDPCKVTHLISSADWKCGDKCMKEYDKNDFKECNGVCVDRYHECETGEIKSTDEETSINPQNEEDTNRGDRVCPEGKFICGSQCVNDDLKFMDCDGACLDKTTLKNGTCPDKLIKESHTKLIVGLSVGIFFLLSLVSLTYNAVVTCKKYKAIQPVDRNVEYGITEPPSTFCWVIQHIPFYCSDDMRREIQQQAELVIEPNPIYGMEMDEYEDPEYNGTELVDYNDYYGESD